MLCHFYFYKFKRFNLMSHIYGSKMFKEPRYNCVILEGIIAEICVQTHAKFK